MCLTLANATAIIDHQPTVRPAGRGYTRTWHHAGKLSPGDLWRPDPDKAPHTVTEVQGTLDRATLLVHITVIDQYARPFRYGSDELVPTAVPDPGIVPLAGMGSTR